MSNIVLSTDSELSKNVEMLTIVSNEDSDRQIDMLGGLVQFDYYESVLNHTVKVECIVVDSGSTLPTKDKKEAQSISEGLPLCGKETVFVKFRDINDNLVDLRLYVNKFTPIQSDSTIQFELVSKEFIMNTGVKVMKRLDGAISQTVEDLVKVELGSEKKIDCELTSNHYNFIGNRKKPFYIIDFLSKHAVSSTNQEYGKTAGYFFYETSEGYFFKSIDGLLNQEKKASMIYNETPDANGARLPEGYTSKIHKYEKENFLNSNKKSMMGTYGSKLVLFDPFNSYYEERAITIDDTEDGLKTAGENIKCHQNPEFAAINNITRTIYQLTDRGTLPVGNTNEQIKKSKELRFDHKSIMVQSIMRYNQLFSYRYKIAIPFNLSIHAGDAIFVDFPKLSDGESDDVDKLSGGLYIITDIRHRISIKGSFTYCNLIRDSFGRIGTPNR